MGRPTDVVDRQGQPKFHPSSYGLGATSGPAQFALAEPKTVGAAIRSPQLPPKTVRMHPTNEKQSLECFLVRCCARDLAVARRMRDPRRRFWPAGGAFTLYVPTSDAPLLSRRLWAPPSQLQLPDQLPPRVPSPDASTRWSTPCDVRVGFTQRPRALVSAVRFKGQRA